MLSLRACVPNRTFRIFVVSTICGGAFAAGTAAQESPPAIPEIGLPGPGLPSQQSRKKYLPYRSYEEFVAERYHSSIEFLKRLNPGVRFSKLKIGDQIRVPNVEPFKIEDMPPTGNFAEDPKLIGRRIVINRRETILDLFDGDKLIASIPIAPGSPAHPTPPGKWR